VSGFEAAALLAKMATSATVVVLASLAIERAGPLLGALIATLPVSAGPAFAFLAAEHGPEFLAEAALASLPAVAASAALIGVYAPLAQRRGVVPSLGAGLLGWFLALLLGRAIPGGLPAMVAFNLAAYGLAWLVVRPYRNAPAAPRPRPRRWELPARAAAVMAVTAAAVLGGRVAGPGIAGAAALAPVVFASLAAIMHLRLGGGASATVLANSIPPMLGFVAAASFLHLAAVPLGSVAALLGALAICVGWNAILFLALRRRPASRAAAISADRAT